MKKLTSSDIDWEDGKFIAVVRDKNIVDGQYPSQVIDETNIIFIFEDCQHWYNKKYFYIVYRKPKPVKKTVVDAVDDLEAYINPHDENEFDFIVLTHANRIVMSREATHGKQYICTIKEFNQCVKELSEASWLNDGEPMFYHVYKQAFKDMESLGCDEAYYRETPKPTYKYEKVTDLTLNEIAKAMIDGEVFYSESGANRYSWKNGQFTDKYDGGCFVTGDYYREVEVIDTRTPSQVKIDSAVQDIESAMFELDHKEAIALCEMLQERGHFG